MPRFVLARTASALMVIGLVLSATFVVLVIAPGEPGDRYDDPRIPREQRSRLRALYGFDRPLPERYGRFVWNAARGEWGYSLLHARPVAAVIKQRLPASLFLGGAALGCALVLGSALGALAARTAHRWFGRALDWALLALYALPPFWLGLMAILVFAHRFGWLPPGGMRDPFHDQWAAAARFADIGRHLILPALVLAAGPAVEIARHLRGALLDLDHVGWLRAARARGLSRRSVWLHHGLRPALLPVVQLLAASAPFLLGGAVAIEAVFDWPGLGGALVGALAAQDHALALAATGITALLVVLSSLAGDLAQRVLDPRLRTGTAE